MSISTEQYRFQPSSVDIIRPPEGEGHSEIVVLTGVDGTGKSSYLRMLQDMLQDSGLQFLSGGLLLQSKIGVDRDSLKKAPLDELDNQYDILYEELTSNTPCVFDGHVVLQREGKLVFDLNFFHKLNPVYYIILEEDPQVILKNRERANAEGRRVREIGNIQSIKDHQAMIRFVVDRLTRTHKSGMSVVFNQVGNESSTRANAEFMAEIIKQIAVPSQTLIEDEEVELN